MQCLKPREADGFDHAHVTEVRVVAAEGEAIQSASFSDAEISIIGHGRWYESQRISGILVVRTVNSRLIDGGDAAIRQGGSNRPLRDRYIQPVSRAQAIAVYSQVEVNAPIVQIVQSQDQPRFEFSLNTDVELISPRSSEVGVNQTSAGGEVLIQ